MKKYALALVLVALMPVVSAGAYEYTQSQGEYTARRPVVKTKTVKKSTNARKTGGYNNVVSNNFYYGQPAQYASSKDVSADADYRSDYRSDYRGGDYYRSERKQTKRATKSYSSQERKYFLAHPFFQPLKGNFGSVTDFSYAKNSFKFDLLNGSVLGLDPNVAAEYGNVLGIDIPMISGKAETSQFAIKEDFSYGLTDRLALVVMAQYDKTKTTFKDWTGGEGEDSRSDSGLNLYGIGLQGRFVDTDEWIAMSELYFQHQKDTANTFIGGIKAGYKIDRTTIYGLGRISYTNLIDGDIYGAFVNDATGDWLMLSYNTNAKDIFQVEGGLGAFAVLDKYFTLNGEMLFGHYDWHNQLNIKGALGWQPADSFALNLYASTVLYDSAKGKVRQYLNYDVDPELPSPYTSSVVYVNGDYKIKTYNEWKVGVQAILHF